MYLDAKLPAAEVAVVPLRIYTFNSKDFTAWLKTRDPNGRYSPFDGGYAGEPGCVLCQFVGEILGKHGLWEDVPYKEKSSDIARMYLAAHNSNTFGECLKNLKNLARF